MDKNTRAKLRCEQCGRFVGWESFRGWYCDHCDLSVSRRALDKLLGRA